MSTFVSQINRWTAKVNKQAENFYPAFVEKVGERLIEESPEISGRLKAHWHVSLSEDGEAANNRKDPGGVATLTKMVSTARSLPVGSTFYIINNVESQPGDDGPPGIHYAGVVNGTPDIRYNNDFYPMSFPSFMFFDRVVGGSMLSHYANEAAKGVII